MSDFSYSDIISKEIDRLDSMPPEEYRKSPVVKEIVEQFTEQPKQTIRQRNIPVSKNLFSSYLGKTPKLTEEKKAPTTTKTEAPHNYIDQYAEALGKNNVYLREDQYELDVNDTVGPTADWITSIKANEDIENVTVLDDYTEQRLAAMQRQVNSVSNSVNTLSENTLVSGIGHGAYGSSSGGGEVNILDLDDVETSSLINGDTLIWNSTDRKFRNSPPMNGITYGVDRIISTGGLNISPQGGFGVVDLSVDLAVNELRDVQINVIDPDTLQTTPTLAKGDLLVYDDITSKWINRPAKSDEIDLLTPTDTTRYSRHAALTNDLTLTNQSDANIYLYNTIIDLDERIDGLQPDPDDVDATNLDDLTDVDTTGQLDGHLLQYSETSHKWQSTDVTMVKSTTGDELPIADNSKDGDIFFKEDDEELYIYTNEWNKVSSQGASSSVIISAQAPLNPTDGDLWVDTDDYALYVYYEFNWIGLTNSGVTPGDSISTATFQTIVANSTSWATFKSNVASHSY